MRNYAVFLKKELLENIRTYKFLVIILVFVILGMMNPLVAKLTPVLLKQMMPEGVKITMPEPTALDAWVQFFKNMTQMGVFVILIVFSGIIGTELSRGTLVNMVTRGLSRRAIILSKYSAMVILWTLGLTINFMMTWGYTSLLFPKISIDHLLFSVFCLWLFVVFLLSVLIFSATFINHSFGTLLFVGATTVMMFIMNFLVPIQKNNPLRLVSAHMELWTHTVKTAYFINAICFTALCSAGLVILSIAFFRKKLL